MDFEPSDKVKRLQARLREFREEAEESLERQRAVEAADSGSFEEYLAKYFARGSAV